MNIQVAQNTTQTKWIKEQLKVIKLKQEIEAREFYNMTFVVNELLNTTKEQQIKNYITKHFIYVNLVLTKHMAETNTFIEIVQQAKLGIIHPVLITPQELLEHIKDIKVSLPGGTDLPTDLDITNIYELVKLSDLAIYYANDNIVFILTLPLIYQYNFILYNLIPKPVCKENNCVYIKPSNKFLAISRSKEHYATYDEFHYTYCKHAREFLLCPEIHPLHPRSIRPICEVQLLQDPENVPYSCETMHVQIATTIFHKLRFKNEWIYITKKEVIFVTCDEDKESTSHILEGVGKISLNETCKGYATRDVLIPGKIDYKAEYSDFIPKSRINTTGNWEYVQNNNLMEDYHVKTNKMEDLNTIANTKQNLDKTKKENNKLEELKYIQSVNNYILYLLSGLILITVLIIITYLINQNKPTNYTNTNTDEEDEEEMSLQQGDQHEATAPRGIDIIEFPLTPCNSQNFYPKLKTTF